MGDFQTGAFNLIYEETEEGVSITGLSGNGASLEIPDVINGKAVREIRRKTFLGKKGIREIIIPSKVELIDDWAFSQCIHLNRVIFKGGLPKIFGRGVFDGCSRISQICVNSLEDEDLCFILAAVVNRLPAAYLITDSEVGGQSWYNKWDLALNSFLLQDDHEGYSDRALCGEEDISYDGIGSVDGELLGEDAGYIKEVAKNKCFLCLLRLYHNRFLEDKNKESFSLYIKNHSKGKGNEAAWSVMKEDLKDELDYFKVFMDVVDPDFESYNAMLSDMGEGLTQAKAYLMRIRPATNKTDSFFDAFSL